MAVSTEALDEYTNQRFPDCGSSIRTRSIERALPAPSSSMSTPCTQTRCHVSCGYSNKPVRYSRILLDGAWPPTESKLPVRPASVM